VRLIGLEPTRLATPDPKSGAATNYAIAAETFFGAQRYINSGELQNKREKYLGG
jgi:hypothetical protein